MSSLFERIIPIIDQYQMATLKIQYLTSIRQLIPSELTELKQQAEKQIRKMVGENESIGIDALIQNILNPS